MRSNKIDFKNIIYDFNVYSKYNVKNNNAISPAIYLRTDEKNTSEVFEVKKKYILSYCNFNKIPTPIKYIDYDFNGSIKGFYRAESINKLLKDIKSKKVDTIILYEIRDISENEKVFLNLLDYFVRYNIRIIIVSDDIDTKIELKYLELMFFIDSFMKISNAFST